MYSRVPINRVWGGEIKVHWINGLYRITNKYGSEVWKAKAYEELKNIIVVKYVIKL